MSLPVAQPFEQAALVGLGAGQVGDAMQAGRFDVEIPQQGLAGVGQEGGDVGGEDAAADAALVAVEGDDEGCHAASL